METWKMLLLTLLIAVVLGCIAGVLIGKYAVKRANSERKPLLSFRERIIYSALIVVGIGMIVFANVYTFPTAEAETNPGMEDGMLDNAVDGEAEGNATGGDGGTAIAQQVYG